MFSELRILLFVCFRSTHGWMGVDVWVNVFRMPFLCADSGPWGKMSRAWPPMSAITTSSGTTGPSHQESAWGAAVARQERVILWVVRKAIVAGPFVVVVFKYFLNTSTNIFCQYCPRREDLGRGPVLKSICQAFWRSPTTTLDRKRTTNRRRRVWWVEFSLFVALGVCMGASVSVDVVRKGIIGGLCWSICWTLSQTFSVTTVLGDKASEVEQVPSFLKVDHQHTGQEEDQ